MIRYRFALILVATLAPISLSAQKRNIQPLDNPVTDNVVQAPEQLRRVPPPADNLTAAESEAKGDELRTQKNYADALDYYHAAMRRQDSAVLENKAGIAELQMLRYDLAKKSFERSVKLDPKYSDAHNNLG